MRRLWPGAKCRANAVNSSLSAEKSLERKKGKNSLISYPAQVQKGNRDTKSLYSSNKCDQLGDPLAMGYPLYSHAVG